MTETALDKGHDLLVELTADIVAAYGATMSCPLVTSGA